MRAWETPASERFDPKSARRLARCAHAGGAVGLGDAQSCLAGGVDSLDPSTLAVVARERVELESFGP